MSNDRNYRAGTTEALFLLSRGHCYHPDCKHRVMEWNGNEWRKDVQVAHIRGLPGGPRHDASLSKYELNHFSNLLLMCKKHHDLVDKPPTGDEFSPETLIEWKAQREGDLAVQLDQLDWVTEDKIQEFMANAISATHRRLNEAIDRASGVGQETLELLRQLMSESFERPYLDAEAVESLERSATTLYAFSDYVPSLERSASDLRSLPDHSSILYQAARELQGIGDHAATLIQAADLLANLERRAPAFLTAADLLSNSSEHIERFHSAVQGLGDSRLPGITSDADDIREAARQLKEAYDSWTKADKATIDRVAHNLAVAAQAGSRRNWSWKAFGLGLAVCAVFVVIVLATTH